MNEINFPSLASSFGGAGAPIGWKQSGSDLARAWSEADEEQRMREELRRQREEREQRSLDLAVGRIRRPYSYGTEERTVYEQDYDLEERAPVPSEEDGWEQVDRHRKKKPSTGTMGWKPMTPPYPPETTVQESVWGDDDQDNEDSVW
jgi:hypothetical protein